MPGRVIADCAEDARAIMSDLSISRAAVWGSSAGGPYALGTAARLPGAVVAVCTFASIGPYGMPGLDFAGGMSDAFREEIRKFFDEPAQARAEFRVRAAEIVARHSSADWWLDRWGERAGQDAAHSRERADYLAVCARDGFGEDDQGWWDDWSASFRPWQFDLTDIQAPVSLWHGLKDAAVPAAHARWLAGRIPHVTAHFPGDEDHTNIEENNRGAAYAWLRTQI